MSRVRERVVGRRRFVTPARLVALGAVTVAAVACSSTSPSTGTPTTSTAGASPSDGLQNRFVDVVKTVRPAVVEIATADGLGSGVVYDANGDIVTNAHVVGSSTQFQVTLSDGRTLTGTLVGTYAPDDLAVIRVAGPDLPSPATLADSSQVQAGDLVLAIGNPLGLSSTVTDGIVSDTGRTVDEGNGVVLPTTIQTSASINPGNSGGALVSLAGSVIGIPTLAATDPELGGGAAPGIGFAVPSNTVKLIADQLVRTGTVTNSGRSSLGVQASTATDRAGNPEGVLIRSVLPNGAATNAGIPTRSVITAVGGQPTPDVDTLSEVLAGLPPNSHVAVSVVLPTGANQTFNVLLTELAP